MIDAIVITNNIEDTLDEKILKYFTQLNIVGKVDPINCTKEMILREKPKVVFLDVELSVKPFNASLLEELSGSAFETIIVSDPKGLAIENLTFDVCGFILKPINIVDLLLTVDHTLKFIQLKEEKKQNKKLVDNISNNFSENKLIGIPTIEGYNFMAAGNIIRCEGLQRCTRIVTIERSNIVSSYNLGEFRKMLEPFGFFSPHRSHLISIRHIKKYLREGTIIMSDDSCVPVSKKRKKAFLDSMTHL